jgi:hypothetical protein
LIVSIVRQNISVLGHLPSIGKSFPLANRASKACLNFAAACGLLQERYVHAKEQAERGNQ